MSKTVEDFDLSYADNKNSKNSSNIFPKNSRSKNVSNRKRTRENEIIPDDGGQHKRIKNSNTSNLDESCSQQLIKEYNNMKQIYEEERVNQ